MDTIRILENRLIRKKIMIDPNNPELPVEETPSGGGAAQAVSIKSVKIEYSITG